MNSDIHISQLRSSLRQKRQALSTAQQQQHALQAVQHLQSFLASQGNTTKRIGFFLSQDGELDTAPSIHHLWYSTEHNVYLPALETKPDWHMGFVEYNTASQMIDNQFGIPEPALPLGQHIAGEQLDITLMPLVGFDRKGNRLGMGGGYYDRSFAFKKNNPNTEKQTLLIGWAHSCQQVEQLDSQPWDVPLDGIITEQGFVQF